MGNHLSTGINNLCILPESIACHLFLTLGIPYLWIFIYLGLFFAKYIALLTFFVRNFTNIYTALAPDATVLWDLQTSSDFYNISLQLQKGLFEKMHFPLSTVS